MKWSTQGEKVRCPECGGELVIYDELVNGLIIDCPFCGAEYEVKINNEKIEVVPLEITGEDWGE